MKRLLFFMFVGTFVNVSFATTVNYNWLVDGTNYAQTTCNTGDDLILPTPTPTKYGYHFVGWRETTMYGSWSQSGTPTPENPISPVFKPFGNTVLRAVGTGDNLIADTYNPETGTITRRIGVKIFDGTENLVDFANVGCYIAINDMLSGRSFPGICSHTNKTQFGSNNNLFYWISAYANTGVSNLANFKQWLAGQYNAGTPVTIYYPLATPVEENIQ